MLTSHSWCRSFVVFLGLAATVHAATLYVDPDAPGPRNGLTWCTAYKTIDQALAVAGPGTTIRVANGTYRPDSSLLPDPRAATFKLKNGVTLQGAYAGCGAPNPDQRDFANNTSFLEGDLFGDPSDADNVYHVVTASGVDGTAVLDGFYIEQGRASNPAPLHGNDGGGLIILSAKPTILSCIFQDDTAVDASGDAGRGGSVYALDGSKTTFKGCLFRESVAGLAGGGVYLDHSSPVFESCTWAGDIAKDGGGLFCINASAPRINNGWFVACHAELDAFGGHGLGGAISLDESNPTIDRTLISGCTAALWGGGMYALGSLPLIVRSTFLFDRADDLGGGIYDVKSSPRIVSTKFLGNDGGRQGGGMYNDGSYSGVDPIELMNCAFSGNGVDDSGGGMYDHGGALVQVVNSTFSRNTAGTTGGGIEIDGNGTTLANDIFWLNTGATGPDEDGQIHRASPLITVQVDYTDIEGLTGGLGGVGNIDADPQFVDPIGPDGIVGTQDDDLRIRHSSPCVDAGSNAAILADFGDLDGDGNVLESTPLDLALVNRIVNRLVDMGAFEWQLWYPF